MNSLDNLAELHAYCAGLGLNDRAIEKVLNGTTVRDVALIRQKVVDYQTLLQVDAATVVRLITAHPKLLNYDVLGNVPTSAKNKIQDYQKLFQTDAATIVKMVLAGPQMLNYDVIGDGPTAVKTKVKDYQTVLQTDAPTVSKMIIAFSRLLDNDVMSDSPTSIKTKMQDYQALLQADAATVSKMMIASPQLLGLDVKGDGPTAVQAKIKKMTAVVPVEQVREWITQDPNILGLPAQAFKIRYMLAENLGLTQRFLRGKGFMVNQSKVWARSRYLNQHTTTVFNMNNIYRSEKLFSQRFGVQSADLMQRYPLDQVAVAGIEKTYFQKTGQSLTLDQQERTVLGLEG